MRPFRTPGRPSKKVRLMSVVTLPPDSFFAALDGAVVSGDSSGTLVFIHGYNVRFETAARFAAQIGHDLGFPYLLAQRRGEERVYRVSRIVSARERAEPCTRPPDFDLAAAWARRSKAFERSRTQIEVTVRVPRGQIRYLRGARVVEDGERPTVIARFDGLGHAFHSLLAYGAQAEVLAPRELRERIAVAAAETVALYTASSS